MADLRERLRGATADLHAAVEREIGLLDPRLDRTGYAGILARLHGFHAALEPAVAAALADPAFFDPRRRLPDLDADCAVLSVVPGTAAAVPRLAEPAAAMGALYVTEGARLGGRLVARHLRATLGIGPGEGARYFAGAEAATGALWASYRERLATCEAEGDTVVAAARATFEAFRRSVCRPHAEASA